VSIFHPIDFEAHYHLPLLLLSRSLTSDHLASALSRVMAYTAAANRQPAPPPVALQDLLSADAVIQTGILDDPSGFVIANQIRTDSVY